MRQASNTPLGRLLFARRGGAIIAIVTGMQVAPSRLPRSPVAPPFSVRCLMLLVDLSLDSPAQNLALDEALLGQVERGELPSEGVLRLWESAQPMVVLGRGSRLEDEVNLAACREQRVAVLRRVSGGTSIVAGPGCLMYAVVAPHPEGGPCGVDHLHRSVLGQMAEALRTLDPRVELAGTSDLALRMPDAALQKFSGNSLRMTRTAFLYHGTLLYDFDLPRVARYLGPAVREPEYRQGRDHTSFLTNLAATRGDLAAAIARGWQARENRYEVPRDQVAQLCRERYEQHEWTASV